MTDHIKTVWASTPAEVADEISEPRLQHVYVAWLGMPEYPGLPSLASVDQANFTRLWPNVVLVECMTDGRLRYRFAGAEVIERVGRDLTGSYVDEVIGGSSLAVLTALYGLAARARAATYSRTLMTTPTIGAEMVIHRLMLPLSNDRRRVDMILAAQTFETAAGPADFTIGGMNRSEWNCEAWVDASQACAAGASL